MIWLGYIRSNTCLPVIKSGDSNYTTAEKKCKTKPNCLYENIVPLQSITTSRNLGKQFKPAKKSHPKHHLYSLIARTMEIISLTLSWIYKNVLNLDTGLVTSMRLSSDKIPVGTSFDWKTMVIVYLILSCLNLESW